MARDLQNLEISRKAFDAATSTTTLEAIQAEIDSVGFDLYYKALDLTYIGFVF